MYLQKKKILLGICGGIAAYKVCSLIRTLREHDAEVRVVMTQSAQQFITPLTLQTLSTHQVYTDLFPAQSQSGIPHLDLQQWADIIVVVPATANIMAKAAHGIADDLLSTILLSHDQPAVFAVAMHDTMCRHPATQQNMSLLKSRGHILIPPEHGKLADNSISVGRLAEEATVLSELNRYCAPQDLKDLRILVTAGRTEEVIDPVRFISNASSGKMGTALAAEAVYRGAAVTMVHGLMQVGCPPHLTPVPVRTADEMKQAVAKHLPKTDIVIMAAAVSDFKAVTTAPQKIKKTDQTYHLHLGQTDDILLMIGQAKGTRYVVAFSVETENEISNTQKKLAAKQCDLMILNNPETPGAAFGSETNKVTILRPDGTVEPLPLMSKSDVAREILNRVASQLKQADET